MVARGDGPDAPAGELRIREAVRGLVLAPPSSLLLVRFEFPTATVWAPPGGGLEPGEDHEGALRRELHEELGLVDVDVGAHVWTREHVVAFLDGLWDGQRDRYHVVPVDDRFEPRPALGWDALRAERVHEVRWWTLEEIDAATAAGTRFAPGRLAELARDLIEQGPPDSVVDTGV
ncbi:NUDIX domain-containing protein [Ilumatobacter sp.]|uniref:NUDIX domain-containing protein n=1 Tax=Ilumatobacter sp. TaxID=1967498 RepID=UPI003B51598B